jgi:DNA repair ATPase RecN
MTTSTLPSVEELASLLEENKRLTEKLKEKEEYIDDLHKRITSVQNRLAHTMVQLSISRAISGTDL